MQKFALPPFSTTVQGLPNESWKISKVNSNYELCDTYPAVIVVPTSVKDDDLSKVSAFRAKGRVPVSNKHHYLGINTDYIRSNMERSKTEKKPLVNKIESGKISLKPSIGRGD